LKLFFLERLRALEAHSHSKVLVGFVPGIRFLEVLVPDHRPLQQESEVDPQMLAFVDVLIQVLPGSQGSMDPELQQRTLQPLDSPKGSQLLFPPPLPQLHYGIELRILI
jgi:hypothetical protein